MSDNYETELNKALELDQKKLNNLLYSDRSLIEELRSLLYRWRDRADDEMGWTEQSQFYDRTDEVLDLAEKRLAGWGK